MEVKDSKSLKPLCLPRNVAAGRSSSTGRFFPGRDTQDGKGGYKMDRQGHVYDRDLGYRGFYGTGGRRGSGRSNSH